MSGFDLSEFEDLSGDGGKDLFLFLSFFLSFFLLSFENKDY